MSVRAKFICVENGKAGYSPTHITSKIVLQPIHGTYGDSEENKQFFAATPGGKIELSVVNTTAAEQFEVGKAYYVDFTPAE